MVRSPAGADTQNPRFHTIDRCRLQMCRRGDVDAQAADIPPQRPCRHGERGPARRSPCPCAGGYRRNLSLHQRCARLPHTRRTDPTAARRARPTKTCCATFARSTGSRRRYGRRRSTAPPPVALGRREVATPRGVVLGGDMTDDGGGQRAEPKKATSSSSSASAISRAVATTRCISRFTPVSATTTSTRTG